MKQKTKKETVTIANYQQLAMRTCLPACKNKDYAYWGSLSEYHELQSKISGYKAKKIRGDSIEKLAEVKQSIINEIGDCFWFISLQCTLAKKSFEHIYKMKIKDLNDIELGIKSHTDDLKKYCKEWKVSPLTCMKKNIDKLSSRKARGVLKGNGDER